MDFFQFHRTIVEFHETVIFFGRLISELIRLRP
jgi:hypothetical protein